MTKKRRRGLSIKIVSAIYSAAVIVILTIITVVVGYRLYEEHVMDHYIKYTTTVLDLAHSVANEFSFGDMIADRDMPEAYEEMRDRLNSVKESSEIDYLYAVYFDDVNDMHSLKYAINAKTAEEKKNGGKYTYLGTPCEEGSFQDETLLVLQDAVKTGKKESGLIQGYSQGYGYMFNGYKVIFDSEGKAAGLMCVEINIENIKGELNRYIRNIVIFVAAFTILITAVFVALSEFYIIHPVARLTRSAKEFIRNIGEQDSIDKCVSELKSMDIHSKNEIGDLYTAIIRMESGMADQYRDIRQYSANVLKMQDGLILLMALMVENRDSETGNHIQKTAAYVSIILNGLKNKGYYLDELTPRYMGYVEKSAPLHDVGKIRIPDVVLNKPGKLTPEEYEIMKTHASAGKDIIDKAIATVEGENYLSEARNMAAYHHERWDGKGYPEGLKGEEIPLSARVMAVADVFDALSSRRVYKPAFPLDEALRIIEEGKGSQFDPKCVEAFMDALPEVKEVLAKYNQSDDAG